MLASNDYYTSITRGNTISPILVNPSPVIVFNPEPPAPQPENVAGTDALLRIIDQTKTFVVAPVSRAQEIATGAQEVIVKNAQASAKFFTDAGAIMEGIRKFFSDPKIIAGFQSGMIRGVLVSLGVFLIVGALFSYADRGSK
jgi:hypothetical protein